MKIRDTALSNDGRSAAGRWLKALREAGGLSQSELAAHICEPHYTFVSQMETGRRSVPTFYIDKLSTALNVPRGEFAKELLRHQDPFMHSALFGSAKEFEELLQSALIERDRKSFNLEEPIMTALSLSGVRGMNLSDLQAKVELAVGRKLHYQSVSQTLRKLEKANRVRRIDSQWSARVKKARVTTRG